MYRDLTQLENRPTGEIEVDSIWPLEEQIGENKRSIIELKRTQNSLLNVSRLPPEILGDVFGWNAIRKETFDLDPFEKKPYNFLLVCHHWFEVASTTPELWGFWGNNLQDWAKRHLRYPTAPLDLVLDGVRFPEDTLDDTLRNALRDRAARDTIRQIHLVAEGSELLSSIISPLTANCEGIQSSSVESVIIQDKNSDPPVDISDFFTHYRFPQLQRLELSSCAISSWDIMTSRTSVLTVLNLCFDEPSPAPTTKQMLGVLASNPTLQKIQLAGCTVPDDGGDGSHFRVPLHHLKILDLTGDFRNVVGLLHRLDHAESTDLTLALWECAVGDISPLLGPYLRDYFRRRGRAYSGLGLCVSWHNNDISFRAGDGGGIRPSALGSEQMASFMAIMIYLNTPPSKELLEKAFLDFIADTPREKIVHFSAHRNPGVIADVYTQLPNLRTLHLDTIRLSAALPKPSPGEEEGILPSLRHVVFDRMLADGGNWKPLATFLSHRASPGNRLDSLTIVRSSYMRPELAEGIRSVVRNFTIDRVGRK